MKKRWTMAPLLALTLALNPVSLAGGAEQGSENINVSSALVANNPGTAASSQTVTQGSKNINVNSLPVANSQGTLASLLTSTLGSENINVNSSLVANSQGTLASLPASTPGSENINGNSTLIAVSQGAVTSPQTTAQAQNLKTLTMDDALKLAEQNNINLQIAQFERDKKKAAAGQAVYQRRDVPDYLDKTKVKDQARVNEKQKQAEFAVADRTYEVTKAQIDLAVKNSYLNVLKAKDRVALSQSGLERAQEQERQAEVALKVGTVAKNDVLVTQAGVSSAQAKLTDSQNTYRLAQIELSKNIGLPVDTQYNLTTNVQYQPMGEVDLNKVIEDAQKSRLDIMKASSDIDVAKAYYDLVVGYSAAYTYDAKQAKSAVDQASLKLDDTKKTVASDLTKAYLNVQATQKQLDAYTAAVESSKESLRLTQLRYQVGMATSLDVLTASDQLSQSELNRVEALYYNYMAKLSFETAQLAPLPAL